ALLRSGEYHFLKKGICPVSERRELHFLAGHLRTQPNCESFHYREISGLLRSRRVLRAQFADPCPRFQRSHWSSISFSLFYREANFPDSIRSKVRRQRLVYYFP